MIEVRKECKVALGGDGGDELFGGYHHHSRLLWMKDVLGQVPYSIRKAISLSANYALPVGFKGKNYLKALGTDFTIDLPLVASHFDSDSRGRILKRSQYLDPISEEYMRSRIPHQKDFLRRLTQMDFENYLPEDILVKVDRASMLNSLEIRSPFLDLDVIEFAFKNIPAELKCNHTERKILLKKLTEKLLPNEFDRTRKQGFSIPLAAWLKSGPFRKFFLDVLYDKDCIFNTKFVNSLIAGQDNGRANSERLFSLVLFELWRREYSIEL
jgi:asparagine synthase (glutamine-hydrolysing)